MKKKLLYITILTVIVLLQFLVVKQYIADKCRVKTADI
jgi:hypothetical protein